MQAGYIDDQGSAETVVSNATAVVSNVNDAPTGSVTIGGVAVENQTLTAANTLSDADGLSGPIGYQWLRDGVAISGATANSYTLGDADVGSQISVQAGYIDDQGTAESVTSAAVGPVSNVNDAPTGAVTIGGVAVENQTLTASNTSATPTASAARSATNGCATALRSPGRRRAAIRWATPTSVHRSACRPLIPTIRAAPKASPALRSDR
nr:hypothetical protein [Methylomarinum sp. Ch1-1]MDP4519662.1 hypothetical protein [Methylomarinum sp. Ch1-1]